MLANTQSIREHSCLTCQKICRRDSKLRIVRCCPKITPRRPAGPVPRHVERNDRRGPPCAANGPKALFAGSPAQKRSFFGKPSVHLKKNKNRLPARTYAGRANTLQHKRGDLCAKRSSFPLVRRKGEPRKTMSGSAVQSVWYSHRAAALAAPSKEGDPSQGLLPF